MRDKPASLPRFALVHRRWIDIPTRLAMMQAYLAQFIAEGKLIDLGVVLREQLARYPHSRHFDVARIIVDQASKLGMASLDSQAVYPEWQAINETGAEVQAHVIDQYQ